MASQRQEIVLAYDADCGPCSGFKSVVSFLDARRRIRFVPLDVADESGMLAAIAPASRYASFHLVRPAGGGTVWSGSQAILPLMRMLSPWGRGMSAVVEGTPGGVAALSFAYSTLSRLHQRCSSREPRALGGTILRG